MLALLHSVTKTVVISLPLHQSQYTLQEMLTAHLANTVLSFVLLQQTIRKL